MGRFEGLEKVRRIVPVFGTILLFICLSASMPGALHAQDFSAGITQMIERKCEEGGEDVESLVLFLEYLMRHPVDINSAGREELSAIPFMTPFMVESVIGYRNEYGAVVSWSELSLLNGFDESTVEEIRPFIRLESGDIPDTSSIRQVKQRLTIKSRSKCQRVQGLPLSLYARYRMDIGKNASVGFTMESDAEENTFPDFCTFYLNVNDVPLSENGSIKINSLVAGDYSLRFGQGVILWNSFSYSGISSPSSIIKYGGRILPYTSSSENGAYNGLALCLDIGKFLQTSLFFSASRLDAKVKGDAFYSLPEDLLHSGGDAIAAKNALTEYLAGGNLGFRYKNLKIGFTAIGYKYDKKDRRRRSYYNNHLVYDGWWCNFSLDFLYSYKGMRCFGEFALDRKGSFGGLAGILSPISSAVEMAFLCRYYDPAFIAVHSGSISSSSRANNELAFSAVFKWTPVRRLNVNANLSYIYYPHSRFGVRSPSDRWRTGADMDWNVFAGHSVFLGCRYENDRGKDISRFKVRLSYVYDSHAGVSFTSRFETVIVPESRPSFLNYEEVVYKNVSGRFSFALRTTLFLADDWNTRIYCYERDVPQSFSVPAYYGRGTGIYAVATYKPAHWLAVSFKSSGTFFFDRKKSLARLSLYLNLLF